MKTSPIYKLVLTALLAAMACVATMVIRVPTVAGYTNLGDCVCLLAGLVLGPWYGFAAAGVGSGSGVRSSAAVLPICSRAMPTMSPARSSSRVLWR